MTEILNSSITDIDNVVFIWYLVVFQHCKHVLCWIWSGTSLNLQSLCIEILQSSWSNRLSWPPNLDIWSFFGKILKFQDPGINTQYCYPLYCFFAIAIVFANVFLQQPLISKMMFVSSDCKRQFIGQTFFCFDSLFLCFFLFCILSSLANVPSDGNVNEIQLTWNVVE